MLLEFGLFELDLATCKLRRDGQIVPLQPRVFGMLRYLIERRGRVVGRQELIEALWGGHQQHTAAVSWTINHARKALGDEANGSRFIETVRGFGYRFVAELSTPVEDVAHGSETPPPCSSSVAQHGRFFANRPFVGRAPVILQLTAALDEASVGHGRLCLLTGEAGIGKTRVADEFALVVRRRGTHVWTGRCFQHGIAPAFWPFIQILRAACSDSSVRESVRSEGEALLREFELRPVNDKQSREFAPPNGSGGVRFWLLDRLSRWLVRVALSQLRVIELEDMHCADEGSIEVLSLLAPMLAHARLLVLATTRDVWDASPARSALALTTRLRPCEHVPLAGLCAEDVETYLSAVLGNELAARLSRTLGAKTAGNPLFLQEITRVVSAQYARDGNVNVEDVRLPAALTEIIGARLNDLEPRTRALIDAACVIGDEFTVPVLQHLTGLSSAEVLSGLEGAAAVNIVVHRAGGSKHAFTHPLMREISYAALSTAQRANLHAAVGLALEALEPSDSALNELAYHFHHAPLQPYSARAARYGRLAGDAAIRALAYDEAVQCYELALEAQVHDAPEDVAAACELLLCSAVALEYAGRTLEGRNRCQRAIELASTAKLPEVLLHAARELRPSVWLAHIPDDQALSAVELALDLLPEDSVTLRARANAQLAVLPPHSRCLESSLTKSAEAMRLASTSNDAMSLLEAQRARLYGLSGPGSIDEQLALSGEMLRADHKHTWRWSVDAHFARYQAYLQCGDTVAADRALDNCARLASEMRQPFVTWHCDRLRTLRTLHAGRLAEAEQRFAELWVESQRMKLPLAFIYHSADSYALNFARTGSRLPAMFGAFPAAAPWIQALPAYRVLHTVSALEAGARDEALREFRALATDNFAAVSTGFTPLCALAELTDAAIALGEKSAAVNLRTLLAPHANLVVLTPLTHSLGSVCRYLAMLEQFLGRTSEARAYFERAIEANARNGHELERLRATLGLAKLLANGRRPSELVHARELASRVHESAQHLGLQMLATSALDFDANMEPKKRRAIPSAAVKSARRSTRTAKTRKRRA